MFLQSGDKGRGRTCCRWYPSSTLAQTPQPCNPVEGYTDIQRCGPCTHRWDCGSVCVHIHGHVAVVRAAHCEPSRYAPPDLLCQQTKQNKEACGSASGDRSSPLCSCSVGSHRRRSQFNHLYLTDRTSGCRSLRLHPLQGPGP